MFFPPPVLGSSGGSGAMGFGFSGGTGMTGFADNVGAPKSTGSLSGTESVFGIQIGAAKGSLNSNILNANTNQIHRPKPIGMVPRTQMASSASMGSASDSVEIRNRAVLNLDKLNMKANAYRHNNQPSPDDIIGNNVEGKVVPIPHNDTTADVGRNYNSDKKKHTTQSKSTGGCSSTKSKTVTPRSSARNGNSARRTAPAPTSSLFIEVDANSRKSASPATASKFASPATGGSPNTRGARDYHYGNDHDSEGFNLNDAFNRHDGFDLNDGFDNSPDSNVNLPDSNANANDNVTTPIDQHTRRFNRQRGCYPVSQSTVTARSAGSPSGGSRGSPYTNSPTSDAAQYGVSSPSASPGSSPPSDFRTKTSSGKRKGPGGAAAFVRGTGGKVKRDGKGDAQHYAGNVSSSNKRDISNNTSGKSVKSSTKRVKDYSAVKSSGYGRPPRLPQPEFSPPSRQAASAGGSGGGSGARARGGTHPGGLSGSGASGSPSAGSTSSATGRARRTNSNSNSKRNSNSNHSNVGERNTKHSDRKTQSENYNMHGRTKSHPLGSPTSSSDVNNNDLPLLSQRKSKSGAAAKGKSKVRSSTARPPIAPAVGASERKVSRRNDNFDNNDQIHRGGASTATARTPTRRGGGPSRVLRSSTNPEVLPHEAAADDYRNTPNFSMNHNDNATVSNHPQGDQFNSNNINNSNDLPNPNLNHNGNYAFQNNVATSLPAPIRMPLTLGVPRIFPPRITTPQGIQMPTGLVIPGILPTPASAHSPGSASPDVAEISWCPRHHSLVNHCGCPPTQDRIAVADSHNNLNAGMISATLTPPVSGMTRAGIPVERASLRVPNADMVSQQKQQYLEILNTQVASAQEDLASQLQKRTQFLREEARNEKLKFAKIVEEKVREREKLLEKQYDRERGKLEGEFREEMVKLERQAEMVRMDLERKQKTFLMNEEQVKFCGTRKEVVQKLWEEEREVMRKYSWGGNHHPNGSWKIQMAGSAAAGAHCQEAAAENSDAANVGGGDAIHAGGGGGGQYPTLGMAIPMGLGLGSPIGIQNQTSIGMQNQAAVSVPAYVGVGRGDVGGGRGDRSGSVVVAAGASKSRGSPTFAFGRDFAPHVGIGPPGGSFNFGTANMM